MSYNVLEKLFGQNQSRVLKFFFHHPQTALSLQEVARKTAVKNKAVRGVINNLVKLGVLEKPKPNGKAKTKKNKKK
ncbi:MAG: hypothetical protein AAB670_01560 [Patescibacteria group bacterium]